MPEEQITPSIRNNAEIPEKRGGSPLDSGFQLTITVLLGIFGGYWLDKRLQSLPWMTLTGAVLGFTLGLYRFLKPYIDDRKKS